MAQWKAFSAILKAKLNSNKMMEQQIQQFIKTVQIYTLQLYTKSQMWSGLLVYLKDQRKFVYFHKLTEYMRKCIEEGR